MHNILVSAYGCEPFVGSEAGVGWNWVLQMGKNNRLHVITRENNREKIEGNIPSELKDHVRFYYYDAPDFIKKLKKRDKGLYFYYFIWQVGIIKIIRNIIRLNKIDYTMHLSFGSFWMPTFLPCFDIPFIWGPLGGGDCVPKNFLKILPLKERIIQNVRYFLKYSSFLNPMVVYPSKKAKVILARTEESAQTIPKKYRHKVRVILETAMSDEIFELVPTRENNEKIELLYSGRLLAKKNVVSMLRAIKLIPESYNIHLTIVGRGKEKERLLTYVRNNKLESRVTFLEEVSRARVLEMLAGADIYLFPSVQEGGTWSLMEAMAAGLPVICLDCTGMHTITSEDSAVRIEPTNSEIFPDIMAEKICFLANNAEDREKIGTTAKQRIWENFRWDAKGVFMENLLEELDKSN